VILSSIERQLEAMDTNMVQVKYNSRAKSYNFTPTASMNSSQLQPWVEVELEDGQLLRTKLLVSNNQFVANCTADRMIGDWHYTVCLFILLSVKVYCGYVIHLAVSEQMNRKFPLGRRFYTFSPITPTLSWHTPQF